MMNRFVVFMTLVLLAGAAFAQAAQEPVKLDLKTAVQTAFANNPNLGAAEASVDAAGAQLRQSRAAAGPNLSITSRYNYVTEATMFGTVPILEKNTMSFGPMVTMPLYTGGKLESMRKQAEYGLTATQAQAEAARSEIVMGVVEVYLTALQAQDGIAVAEDAVKALTANYDAVSRMKEAGVAVKSDLLRAEVALTNAKEGLLQAENGYRSALAVLKQVMGINQSQQIQLSSENLNILSSGDGSQLGKRAEIRALESAIQASDAGIRVARSGLRPQVGLIADYQHIQKGAFFPRQQDTGSAMVQLSVPVFDSGMSRAQIAQAAADKEKLLKQLKAMQDQVEMEITRAELDVATAEAKLRITEKQEESARESYRTLEVGYREGITPLTDVLLAQSSLTAARMDRLNSTYGLQVAKARLLKARAQLLPMFQGAVPTKQ